MSSSAKFRASGYEIKVVTRKNKCAPPHRTGTYILDFKYGPSPELTMLTDFIRSKILKLAKSPGGPVKRKESELDDDGVPKAKTKEEKLFSVKLGWKVVSRNENVGLIRMRRRRIRLSPVPPAAPAKVAAP